MATPAYHRLIIAARLAVHSMEQDHTGQHYPHQQGLRDALERAPDPRDHHLVQIPEHIDHWISTWRGPAGERCRPAQVLQLLIGDLDAALARPESAEGAGMAALLDAHGIHLGDD